MSASANLRKLSIITILLAIAVPLFIFAGDRVLYQISTVPNQSIFLGFIQRDTIISIVLLTPFISCCLSLIISAFILFKYGKEKSTKLKKLALTLVFLSVLLLVILLFMTPQIS